MEFIYFLVTIIKVIAISFLAIVFVVTIRAIEAEYINFDRISPTHKYPPTLRSRDIGVWRFVFPSFFPRFLSLDVFPSYSSLPFFLFSSSCYGVGPGGVWDIPSPPPWLTECVNE